MTVLALALAAVAAQPVPWMQMGDAQRADAVLALKDKPLTERVLAASERFLGTPYALSPLGEGSGKDADPLVRWDAVDCLTMVEESLALSLAKDEPGVLPLLSTIRYAGAPAYESRLHVMEAQWLPTNLARGYVKDVTRAYGGKATKRVKKVLTAASWKEKSARALELAETAQPKGEFELDIIPADKALAALSKAPAGLIVVVVRADRPWLVTRVSHVAVLVQGKKGPMLRHASRSFKRVVDEPLSSYLTRNLDFGAWTIEGLAVFEPADPGAATAP